MLAEVQGVAKGPRLSGFNKLVFCEMPQLGMSLQGNLLGVQKVPSKQL
jgi:hypothetical protein